MACEEQMNPAPAELLCRVHFQAETQTLDLAKVPQLSAFTSPVLVLAVEHRVLPAAMVVPLPTRTAVPGAPPPPLTFSIPAFSLATAEPRCRLVAAPVFVLNGGFMVFALPARLARPIDLRQLRLHCHRRTVGARRRTGATFAR